MPSRQEMFAHSHAYQKGYLLKCATDAGIEPACIGPLIEHLLPRYAKADSDAVHYQKLFVRSAVAVHLLAALAVTIAVGQRLFASEYPQFIWLEVLAMGGALAMIVLERKLAWRNHWLSSRHLAELIRIKMFAVPIRREAGANPESLLAWYESPAPEVQDEIKTILASPAFEACKISDVLKAQKWVINAWIDDQVRFHKKTAERKLSKAGWIRGITLVLFILALIFGVLHATGLDHLHAAAVPKAQAEAADPGQETLAHVLFLLAVSLPAWAGAIHGIGDLLEWERLGERSRRMAERLKQRAQEVQGATDLAKLQDVVKEVELLMAVENYEWMVSIHAKKVKHAP